MRLFSLTRVVAIFAASAALSLAVPTSAAALTFVYQGNPFDSTAGPIEGPVTGTITFDDGAFMPLAFLDAGDVTDFAFTSDGLVWAFGSVDLFVAEFFVNATGDGFSNYFFLANDDLVASNTGFEQIELNFNGAVGRDVVRYGGGPGLGGVPLFTGPTNGTLSPGNFTAVPLPAALPLLLASVAGLGLVARRRERQGRGPKSAARRTAPA